MSDVMQSDLRASSFGCLYYYYYRHHPSLTCLTTSPFKEAVRRVGVGK